MFKQIDNIIVPESKTQCSIRQVWRNTLKVNSVTCHVKLGPNPNRHSLHCPGLA